MNTNELIDNLARDLSPAPALPPPGRRAAAWTGGALLFVAALVVGMRMAQPEAAADGWLGWLPQLFAVATGVLASAAAFASTVPGASRRLVAVAGAAVLAWLGSVLLASPGELEWRGALEAQHEWLCVAVIIAGGVPLLIVLARLLRRGAPLSPALTGCLAALAAASLANIGACLSLPHPNGAVTLVWHGGLTAALALLGAASGSLWLRWRTPRGRS
jgi:hypothetical protein